MFAIQSAVPAETTEESLPSGRTGQASPSSALTLRLEELCRDANPTIYLIDDDPGIRDSLSLLLGLRNLRVQVFANAEDFLVADRPQAHACILLDIRLPGMGGLQLQRTLIAAGNWTPVIIMTANPNIAASRTAFKSGAVDFLLKPIAETELIEALCDALSSGSIKLNSAGVRLENNSALCSLTLREREVLDLLVNGSSSREVAQKLAISHRTVEVYKSRMMEKLGVRKLTDLVRLALFSPP
jgi:FixJ family two-component response regulator